MRIAKGITHEQRYNLCLKKQECPTMKQAELAAWFEDRYSFSISQPTISHSLRKSSEILALGPCAVGVDSTRVRKRPVRHPDLELAIYRWVQSQQLEQQQRWQRRQKQKQYGNGKQIKNQRRKRIEEPDLEQMAPPVKLTGPTLVKQAKKIAQEMNILDTVFCPGWLSRFKSRYNINFTELNEIPSHSQGAITIANDSASGSASSSGTTTPVSGPASNSAVGMQLMEVRPSIAIPSSSHGVHSSPQQATDLHDLDESPMQVVASNDTSFGQLVSIASSMDSLPSQQDLISSHRPLQQSKHSQQQQQRIIYGLQNIEQYPYSHPQDHTQTHQSHDDHHLSLLRPPSTSSALNISLLRSLPASASHQAPAMQYHSPTTTPASSSLTTSNISTSLSSPAGSQYPNDQYSATLSPLPAIQDSRDVQRILRQLRQYVSLHFKDSSRAIEHLNNLELELGSPQDHCTDSIIRRPE